MLFDAVFYRFLGRHLARWWSTGGVVLAAAVAQAGGMAALTADQAGWGALGVGVVSLGLFPFWIESQRFVDERRSPMRWPTFVRRESAVSSIKAVNGPFILYLRSRVAELAPSVRIERKVIPRFRRVVKLPGGDRDVVEIPEHTNVRTEIYPREIESILDAAGAPVLSISHPDDPTPPMSFQWLLACGGFDWRRIVELLAPRATAIVVWYLGSSPGIDDELALLRREHLEPRTILILAPGVSPPAGDWPYRVPVAHLDKVTALLTSLRR